MSEYFSHDYDARNDDKIEQLIYDLGWEGYGLYWALIEMLYQNGGYLAYECERIAFSLRTHCERIDKIINDYDLFKVEGKKLYSDEVFNRLSLRKAKSEKARNSAKARWDKELYANASQSSCERNAKKESKEKENKENRIKENKKVYIQEKEKNNDVVYSAFVDFLFGNNDLGRELRECLALPKDPITHKRFQVLLNKYPKDLVKQKILACETHRDTPTKKKSFSQTINDWCNKEHGSNT